VTGGRRPWTLVVTGPGRPSRSVTLGAGRICAVLLFTLASLGTSLWLGWRLGVITQLL
jgi:hypothetical protein